MLCLADFCIWQRRIVWAVHKLIFAQSLDSSVCGPWTFVLRASLFVFLSFFKMYFSFSITIFLWFVNCISLIILQSHWTAACAACGRLSWGQQAYFSLFCLGARAEPYFKTGTALNTMFVLLVRLSLGRMLFLKVKLIKCCYKENSLLGQWSFT